MVRSPHQEVFLEKTKQSDLRGSFEPQRQGTGLRVCDSDAVAVCIFSGDLRYRGRIASSDVPAPDTSCKIGSWEWEWVSGSGIF